MPDCTHTSSLASDSALALATLLPILGCGEEAAALAFGGLSATSADRAAAEALAQIGVEEQDHARWLANLQCKLPPPPRQADILAKARRFHIQLGVGGVAAHLGRIAALDAAVCTVLSRLLRPGSPLSTDRHATAVLGRIHRDEGRHVAVSRRLGSAHASSQQLRDLAAPARYALAQILGLAGDAFETLGVDADALVRDCARLPPGLFPA